MQQPNRFLRHLVQAVLLAASAAAVLPAMADSADFKAAIDNPARADDRKDDAKRKPAQFLEFAKVQPGMKALDLITGGGATATLLAAAVGPKGEVWAQSHKASPKLDERLAKFPMANLHPFVAPADNPIPANAPKFDLVTTNMNYHDLVNNGVDRAAMNKHVHEALKPGGYYVVIDNAAKDGSGLAGTKELHRIDEAAVIAEVTQAGFKLDAKGDYLRVPGDPREQPFFKMNGQPDDKFALRFVKK